MQFVRQTAGAPRQRAVDAATAQAVSALAAADIPVVLLKGPAIALWLYTAEDPRWNGDCDLLLRGFDLDPAGVVLARLGYERRPNPPDDPGLLHDVHSIVWTRAHDDAAVELHWTLVGLEAEPKEVWAALSENTESIVVAGAQMRCLSEPARALHLALHLAQHGRESHKPSEDLRRGIDRLDMAVWRAARELSAALGGDSAFAAGLRAESGGAELAAALALPDADTYWTMRAEAAPRGALRLRQIRDASGWRERWVYLHEGLSRYREFRDERGERKGLGRIPAALGDLLAALRALRRSR